MGDRAVEEEAAAAELAQALSQALTQALARASLGGSTAQRTLSSPSPSPSPSSSCQPQASYRPRDVAGGIFARKEQARTSARLQVSRRSSPEGRAQATHGQSSQPRDDALQSAPSPRHRPNFKPVQAAIASTVLAQAARTQVMPANQPNLMMRFPPLPSADTVSPLVEMALREYEERLFRLGSGAAKAICSQIGMTQVFSNMGSPIADEEVFATLIKIKAWTNWVAKCHDAVESILGLRTTLEAGIARIEAIERLATQAHAATGREAKLKLLEAISTEVQRWLDQRAAVRAGGLQFAANTFRRRAEGGTLGPRMQMVELQASRRLLLAHRAYVNNLKQADAWTRELNEALENAGAGSEAHGCLDSKDVISDAMALLSLHPAEKPRERRGTSNSARDSHMRDVASPRSQEDSPRSQERSPRSRKGSSRIRKESPRTERASPRS